MMEDVMAERSVRKRLRCGLAAGAAVLALAALGGAVLAACGGDESGQVVRLAPEPNGSASVTVGVGDTVVVSLEANPTTGYEWQFTAGDTFTIEKSEYVPDPNPDELVGKGGTQVVTLKVTEAGESDLTGTYGRSWETPAPGAGPDVTVTIKSTE
jgi:inhibitor of cysteine peptidase